MWLWTYLGIISSPREPQETLWTEDIHRPCSWGVCVGLSSPAVDHSRDLWTQSGDLTQPLLARADATAHLNAEFQYSVGFSPQPGITVPASTSSKAAWTRVV